MTLFDNLFNLTIVLVATLAGVWAYFSVDPSFAIFLLCASGFFGAFLLAFNTEFLCRQDAGRVRLLISVLLIYGSITLTFAIIALTVLVTLSATLWLLSTLADPTHWLHIPESDVGTAAPILIGAFTAYIGNAYFKDAGSPGSRFWPGARFKAHLTQVYGGHPSISGRKYPELYSLLYLDEALGDLTGWTFLVALRRAWRIGGQIHTVPKRPPPS